MSRKLNISIQSSRASSGTIYTWERTSAQRDTSLLLLWRRSDGQEQSVSSSGMPRTDTKASPLWRSNFSPSRSRTTTRTTKFKLKRSLKCVLKGIGSSPPFARHGLFGGVPSVGDTPSFFQGRNETDVRMYQEDVLPEVVKHLNMTLFIGQE
jgi:hypothetical protein